MLYFGRLAILLAAGILLAACSSPLSGEGDASMAASAAPLSLASPITVAFVTAKQGWLLAGNCSGVGNGACMILTTSDGGKTWVAQYRTTLELRALYFDNPSAGWVLGADCQGRGVHQVCTGIILATMNGGATWTPRQTGAILSDLQFVDTRRGWALESQCPPDGAASCPRELWQTSDGGQSWRRMPLPGFSPSGISVVNPTHAWLAGCVVKNTSTNPCLRPAVLASTDGGKVWRRELELPASAGSFASSITFVNRADGWLLASAPSGCGMGGCWGPLYFTIDGGQHWIQEQPEYHWNMSGETPDRPGFPGAPVFVNPLIGWIPISVGAGPGEGGIASTIDGGKTWTHTGGRDGRSITGVSAVTPSDVWLVGFRRTSTTEQPLLLHSTDGGRSWIQQLPRSTGQPASKVVVPATKPPAIPTHAPNGITIELISLSPRHLAIAPGQTGTVPIGNGEIDALVYYAHPLVPSIPGAPGWSAPTVTVSPPGWTPVVGNLGRPDTLTLELFGNATGHFTVTTSGMQANPPVSFTLDVVPNGNVPDR